MDVREVIYALRCEVDKFTASITDEPDCNERDWMPRYTRSPGYLRYLGAFHSQPQVNDFMGWLISAIPQGSTIYDVGCVCGYTGLVLALAGFDVAFHDYEGLGLDFVRWMHESNEDLNISVIPYGQPAPKRDWAIALDVIEHTTNQLGFVRWMADLGRVASFSFPGVAYTPPFEFPLDQWIDAEAILMTISLRYRVTRCNVVDGRTYITFDAE